MNVIAERRMFSKTIIDSDAFLDMPSSTQALYFHLSMRADDDGFINNPKKIQRMTGSSEDDIKLLLLKNFIIPFESGVVVIKHWKIHNLIRSDRYKETVYKDEKAMLVTKENSSYTIGIPSDNQMETQVRLGKDRLVKDSKVKDSMEIKVETPSASATSKIIKNVKQNRIFFENDPELNKEFQYFIDMRNSMKPKPTEHAIDLLIKELEKLSTDNGCFNRDIAIEIVKQSTRSSWKGLFPPKEQRNSSTPQKGKTAQELDSFYGMAKSWAERNRDEQ